MILELTRSNSVLMSVMLMTSSIGGITAPLAAAARAAGAATIFYTIIDAPRKDRSGLKHPEVSASEDIALTNVNFAYSTRPDLKILDNLSITFPAGKVTAIVGPSGAGKSTIVGLIERWYEIEAFESGDMVSDTEHKNDELADMSTVAESLVAQRLDHLWRPAVERDRPKVVADTNRPCPARAFPLQRHHLPKRRVRTHRYRVGRCRC
jgi:ABC-type transport system involved in cytochrome bd biosynthesis fused ATPase/permease subunit